MEAKLSLDLDGRQYMRVIAGSARRLELKTPAGLGTRPTTDRIKETLFNILQGSYENEDFLDLFSGSGGIGIEALSRGAAGAVFVESNREAISCIRQNLEHTHLSSKASVLNMDVMRALSMLEGHRSFAVIFMDPPYGQGLEKKVLSVLRDSSFVDEHTLVIFEADLHTGTDDLSEYGFTLFRTKIYKTNMHVFCRKEGVKAI